MKKYAFTIITILLLSAVNVVGEGTTGAQFLGIGVGARACAMGKAYGAIADDPSGIYWNPAGLSKAKSMQFMVSQNFWLLDMTHQYIAGVFPHRLGTFGVSFYYSSSGDIPRIEDFIKIGEYTAYDAAFNLAYANRFSELIDYGLGVKYINQKIDIETASTFAFDFGVLFRVCQCQGLKLALAVQNIGPGVKFIEESDKLPLSFKLASSYGKDNYKAGVELVREIDSDFMLGLGGEYVISKTLALRGGYNTAHSFSLGFGIYWQKFDLSYSFAPNKDLDSSHRISLIYSH